MMKDRVEGWEEEGRRGRREEQKGRREQWEYQTR